MDILIVDTSLLNSRTFSYMYEAVGCRVVCAADVDQAVEVVARQSLDVVIAGGSFASELGIPLCAAIRAVRPCLSIVVIAGDSGDCSQSHPVFDATIRSTCFYSDLVRFQRGRSE